MYRVEIQTTNPARSTTLTFDNRGSVQLVLDQLKNPDGVISVNAGGAERGQPEGYIPVRAVTTILVSQA